MRTIDVYFRDGQGLRAGCPVRVAGLDAGRVVDVDLIEYEGTLRARARIALPTRARQQAEAGRQDHDPAGTDRSEPGQHRRRRAGPTSRWCRAQVVQGVESTFFDPILEQVGLGPVERNHISHSIAEVRQTVDATVAAGPRDRRHVPDDRQTVSRRRPTRSARRSRRPPSQVEQLTRRLDAARAEDRGRRSTTRGVR